MNCLLCSNQSADQVVNHEIYFWKCLKCDLIFKDPGDFPDFESEKARYETHNNDESDPQYLEYLDRLFSITNFKSGVALDYGCGPSMGLKTLVRLKGLSNAKVESYDPMFYPEADLSQKFDLVFASESFEHFFKPKEEVEKIVNLLHPGGLLAVSTELHDEKKISDWWYSRDPTHVVFFGKKTFEIMAKEFRLKILKLDSPHIILNKI